MENHHAFKNGKPSINEQRLRTADVGGHESEDM